MGQAKRRGARDERVAAAIEHKRVEASVWHKAVNAANNAKTQIMLRTAAQVKKIGVLAAIQRNKNEKAGAEE